jgi:hypothetical protein
LEGSVEFYYCARIGRELISTEENLGLRCSGTRDLSYSLQIIAVTDTPPEITHYLSFRQNTPPKMHVANSFSSGAGLTVSVIHANFAPRELEQPALGFLFFAGVV